MFHWKKADVDSAKNDFRKFLFIVWKEISLPHPTDIQYDIAQTLQNPPSDRFIIEGFRGVAKSFITCAYAVWVLWRDPQKKVLIVSASKDRADANAVFIKKIIFTIEFLSFLRPNKNQRDTQNIFDVGPAVADISPSVKSVGITGQITGSRADVLISDDVEVPNNSGTSMQREKLSNAVKEYDAIIKPGGLVIYLGTPQNEMSLYNILQKDRGYECVIYPVVYPEDYTIRSFYGDRLAKCIADKYDKDPDLYAGKPTDPQRFDVDEINKRRLSYGKGGFSLQFLLNTNLSDYDKFPLKTSDFIVDSLDIEESSLSWSWASGTANRLNELACVGLDGDYYYSPLKRSQETQKYTHSVMFIDPSGRGKDETAYAIVKYLNGYMFLLDVGGFTEGYSENVLSSLARQCKKYGVKICQIEPNYGGGMFAQLLRPYMLQHCPTCSIEDTKSATTQKEARIIDTLEPVLMRHKLIVDKNVIEKDYIVYQKNKDYSLIFQMTRLSRERGSLAHDDKIDALEGAVAYFLDMLAVSEQQGYDDYFDEQFEKWLDNGIFYKDEKEYEHISLERDRRKRKYGFENVSSLDHYYYRHS